MINTMLMTFDEKEPPSSADLFTADIPPTEHDVSSVPVKVSKAHTVYIRRAALAWK